MDELSKTLEEMSPLEKVADEIIKTNWYILEKYHDIIYSKANLKEFNIPIDIPEMEQQRLLLKEFYKKQCEKQSSPWYYYIGFVN
jgi:hypothetical protein